MDFFYNLDKQHPKSTTVYLFSAVLEEKPNNITKYFSRNDRTVE